MNNYEIDKIILKYLKLRKMTQVELANILNVEKTTLNRWCKGKSVPDCNTFLNIAHILNIKLDEIIQGQDDRLNEHKLIKLYESLNKDQDRQDLLKINSIISKMINK